MHFTKMQGLGNDYIYVNTMEEKVENPEKLAVKLSDRHFGIGADGLILICGSKKADVRMEMYNADGSRGKMCGNGIRCVAKYVYEGGIVSKKKLQIETESGIKETVILTDGQVQVNMGRPSVEGIQKRIVLPKPEVNDVSADYISMGNPHVVIYMEELQSEKSLDSLKMEQLGPLFEYHLGENDRVNTEFVCVSDRETIKMRVWERGSGETFACGTGACAAAVSSILRNLTERKVRIKLKGGNLLVKWEKDSGDLYMTGPAVTVFKGDITV